MTSCHYRNGLDTSMDNFSYDVIAFKNTKENANTVRIQEHSSFSGDLGAVILVLW